MLRIATLVLGLFVLALNANAAMADPNGNSYFACPVDTFTPAPTGGTMSIDEEFGEGINAVTTCLMNREKIKLVIQINKSCRDTTVVSDASTPSGYAIENHPRSCGTTRGYGIAQLKNMLRDYTVTHGIAMSKIDIKVVVHGGGGLMMLDMPWNNLKPAVQDLQETGAVKFYFCQNTLRGLAPKMGMTTQQLVSKVLPDVEYVTAGLTAISDLQEQGYIYVQP